MKKAMIRTQIFLPEQMINHLDQQAKLQGITRSEIIRYAINQYNTNSNIGNNDVTKKIE